MNILGLCKKVWISGKLVDNLVEGGKGIGATDGRSAGSWAKCGGVGTFSGASAQSYDEQGNPVRLHFTSDNRHGRYLELCKQQIDGAIHQAKIARETSSGNGAINMNVLWETSGVPGLLEAVLTDANEFIDGITCGAGLPFELAEICAKHRKYYNPIVSSDRAFRILWQRAYSKIPEYLGSVVYEDPWVAGGHNGLTSREKPDNPEPAYPRVLALRKLMNEIGLHDTTIIMAGGVWNLSEWREFIDNPELGNIAFQFGTRPLLTKESPISDEWKAKLFTLKPGDVKLHQFSPTGFFSSAVNNKFLQELYGQTEREIAFQSAMDENFTHALTYGRREIFVSKTDYKSAQKWQSEGHTAPMKTPSGTIIFVTPERAHQILEDQKKLYGVLKKL